jgi:hypothetical protein
MKNYYFQVKFADGGSYPVEILSSSVIKATQLLFKTLSSIVTDEITGLSVTVKKTKGSLLDIKV